MAKHTIRFAIHQRPRAAVIRNFSTPSLRMRSISTPASFVVSPATSCPAMVSLVPLQMTFSCLKSHSVDSMTSTSYWATCGGIDAQAAPYQP